MATGVTMRQAGVREARSGQQALSPLQLAGEVVSVAARVIDGRLVVAAGGSDGGAEVRADGMKARRLRAKRWGHRRSHDGHVLALTIEVLDGKPVIFSGGSDGTWRLRDVRTGRPLDLPLRAHDDGVAALAVGMVEDQQVVVSGGADGAVRLWDAHKGTRLGEAVRRGARVESVAIGTIDGQPAVLSGGFDGTVRLWTPQPTSAFPVGSAVTSLALLDDGVAVGTASSVLVIEVPGLRPSPRPADG